VLTLQDQAGLAKSEMQSLAAVLELIDTLLLLYHAQQLIYICWSPLRNDEAWLPA
jgi:hypothetical protein